MVGLSLPGKVFRRGLGFHAQIVTAGSNSYKNQFGFLFAIRSPGFYQFGRRLANWTVDAKTRAYTGKLAARGAGGSLCAADRLVI
jgi:hypothetical protein